MNTVPHPEELKADYDEAYAEAEKLRLDANEARRALNKAHMEAKRLYRLWRESLKQPL